MINTHLVLVVLSVYTFHMSKTTFPRQGQCLDAYSFVQGTRVVGRDASFIADRTDAHMV